MKTFKNYFFWKCLVDLVLLKSAIIMSSFSPCRGLLIDIPCVGLSFNSWNRSYLFLAKETALLDPVDAIMSMSKNEDAKLFFVILAVIEMWPGQLLRSLNAKNNSVWADAWHDVNLWKSFWINKHRKGCARSLLSSSLKSFNDACKSLILIS